ncbi:MAG: hypothetical protein M1837_004103 [Sclerophora amabilis]|nr:MAG: hypothetical protein M1837_004103 [Sclerophora amabilis]
MHYLVRLSQVHETFRKPELQALASLLDIDIEFISYDVNSPFCIFRAQSEAHARAIVSRSILSKAVYELWGVGGNQDELHHDIYQRTQHWWPLYRTVSFKFEIDSYRAKRSPQEQREIIESFDYLGLEGPILMRHAEQEFCICEDWDAQGHSLNQIYLGRWISNGNRDAVHKYDLKKRHYISTTSMDSELALVTANLTCAGPGKLFLDPFVGTGSFPVACAHFGAVNLGSDIDPRSIRGKVPGRNIAGNFRQYDLSSKWLDGFSADLTNTPIRTQRRLFDGIICDPPYGVREGLKVLGRRKDHLRPKDAIYVDGEAAHLYELPETNRPSNRRGLESRR